MLSSLLSLMPSRPARRATLALAAALAATATPALAHVVPGQHAGLPGAKSPFALAGPSLGGFSSDNVEFVKNFAEHTDTAGGRLHRRLLLHHHRARPHDLRRRKARRTRCRSAA